MLNPSWYAAILAVALIAPTLMLAGCDVSKDDAVTEKVDTREVKERPEPSKPSLDKQL